jgi:hypothetical protein
VLSLLQRDKHPRMESTAKGSIRGDLMNQPEPLSPEVEAIALKALESRVTAQLKLTKVEFGQRYPDGHKDTFRSPVDDAKLGQVWRTDPDPEWRIVNRGALQEHLETFPGNFVTHLEVVGDDAEILAVLDQHAPHLLKEVSEVPEEVYQAALQESRETGEAVAPGIEKIKPGGVLVVKPDKDAGRAIEGMVRAGLLTWDGRRAITSAPREQAS